MGTFLLSVHYSSKWIIGVFNPEIYGNSIYVPSDVIQKAVDLEELYDYLEDEDEGSLLKFYKTLNRHLNRSRTCVKNHCALVFCEYAVLLKRKEPTLLGSFLLHPHLHQNS